MPVSLHPGEFKLSIPFLISTTSGEPGVSIQFTVGTFGGEPGTAIPLETGAGGGEPGTAIPLETGAGGGEPGTATSIEVGVGDGDVQLSIPFNVGSVVVVDFVATPSSGDAPLSVQFTDMSNFMPTSWSWDFGDGNVSTIGPVVTHIYQVPGVYNVTLTVSNVIEGSHTLTKSGYIAANTPVPTASFTLSPVTGYEPLTVNFTDTSTGFPSSWLWDFGDGNTSTAQNPVHTYAVAGDYTVILEVSNVTGTDTSAPTVVQVLPAPSLVADFISDGIAPVPSGLRVQFFEEAIDALTYSWNFGDPASGINNTSTNPDPIHIYPGPGVYLVTLTVTRGPFTDTICKSVLVTTEHARYMEIWGTVKFSDGSQVPADKVVTVNRVIDPAGVDCSNSATETTHTYHTIDDSGTTRFLVRARGNLLSIPDSGFDDGNPVYLYIGGRLATKLQSGDIVPASVPFYMTLPSDPISVIELNIVFPVASTSISPPPGVYQDRVTITLTSNVTPANIYYTLDGTDPKTSSTRQLYTAPFIIDEGVTVIHYYTDDPLGSMEPVNEAVYTVLGPLVIPTPPPSTYSNNLFVTLTGNRQGDIYYRLNYSGGYNLYSSPIPIEAGPSGTRTTVIQAYLVDYHSEVGAILEFTYKIDLINPVISLFTLSNGDLVTASPIITVQVVASSYANSVTGLLLSTFSDFSDASVRLYQPEVTFLLPGPDGTKTVYAKVIDQLGHYSETKSATIVLSTEDPVFTVSSSPVGPIGESSFTFTGTKSSNSGIYLTINGNPESLIVPFGPETTWEYTVTLEVGINTIVFQAGTWVGNRSATQTRVIDSRPIPAGTTEATTITNPDGTWRIPFVFLDEKTGVEATADLPPPRRQHENIKRRQHDFRLRVFASYGPSPVITFPTPGAVLTHNVITVTGTAAPGCKITLFVEIRGKVPA